jgi:hypothetical protein
MRPSSSFPDLMTPAPWKAVNTGVDNSGRCPARPGFEQAENATGSVEWAALGGVQPAYPSRANVDVTLTFPVIGTVGARAPERIEIRDLSVSGPCGAAAAQPRR